MVGVVAMPPLAQPQHHRPDPRFVQPGRLIDARFDQVAGKLFQYHLAKGDIGVESTDQVVTIPPRILSRHIPLIAVRVRVMDDVHPVPRPSLAEVRTVQQRRHQFVISLRRIVGRESLDQFWFRRKSRQRKTEPPDQRAPVRFRHGLQPFGFELGQNEPIDIRPWPVRLLHLRRRGTGDRLQAPPLQAALEFRLPLGRLISPPHDSHARIRRPHLHPRDQVGDHRRRQP